MSRKVSPNEYALFGRETTSAVKGRGGTRLSKVDPSVGCQTDHHTLSHAAPVGTGEMSPRGSREREVDPASGLATILSAVGWIAGPDG